MLLACRTVLLAILAAASVEAFRVRENGHASLVLQDPKHSNVPATLLIRGGGVSDKKDEEDSPIDKKVVSAGVAAVLLSVLAQQINSRLSKKNTSSAVKETPIVQEIVTAVRTIVPVGKPAPVPAPVDTSIIPKTVVSVVLTSLVLMVALYCANLPDVTTFYHNLGLPKEIFGVSPVLYATFLFLVFASSVVTDIVAGGVSTDVVIRPTATPSSEWYTKEVKKPSWNPPGWVFPIMWLLISKPTQFLALRQMFLAVAPVVVAPVATDAAAAAAAADTVAAVTAGTPDWVALAVYSTHLALGNAWNDVFFRYHNIGLGLKVICIFWATLAISAGLFYQTTPWAGYLLLPTLGWVTIATTLNWSIYNLNKDSKK